MQSKQASSKKIRWIIAIWMLAIPVPSSAVTWEVLAPGFPGGNERDLGLQVGTGEPLRHTGTLNPLPENTYVDGWSMVATGSLGPTQGAAILYDQRAHAGVTPAMPAAEETPATPATADLSLSAYLLGAVYNAPQDVHMRNSGFTGPAKANISVVQTFKLLAGPSEATGDPVRVNFNALYQFGVSPGASTKIAGSGSLHGLFGADAFTLEHNGTLVTSHGADPDAGYAWGDNGWVLARIGDTFEVAASVSAWLSVIDDDFSLGNQSAGFSPSLNVTLLAEPVPEPETWMMLLAGCGLAGWAARRHKPSMG